MNAVRTDQDRIDDDVLTGDAFTTTRLIDYLPGLALLIGVGLLGKYAEVWWLAAAKHEHWTVPDIEYVLWAILIGLVMTNTVGLHRVFRPGVLTYHFWLKSASWRSDRALCLARAQAGRHQPGADTRRHGCRRHHNPCRCTAFRLVGQARVSSGDRHLDLRCVGDCRG